MSPNQTLANPTNKTTTTWALDPAHSHADFTVRHLMIANVRGNIPPRSATIVRDESDITKSRVEAELDVAAITTGAADRDNHLRSPDFFDVATYPTIRFVSTRVETVEDGLRVHGDLTIRDVTRPVVLDVEVLGEAKDPWGNTKAAVEATTTFDRRDFGLTWNAALETGGVLVGDKVKVQLALQFVKQG
ncbi:MAG TPA: YceI family protein [Candidatus Thermoplasmatota archaeon]|nr:YceI family protein [Candidatus Thermoplasmatota archaeon]